MVFARIPGVNTNRIQMKKRAQPPDAHTFTILLRGLAMHIDFPRSLDRALAIYESMYATNSPVKPNIAHTNAVLSVCAKRADIDTMLGIAAKLPNRGPGAADNRTYTLFFNTLRSDLWRTNLEMASHMPKDENEIDYESIRRRQTATLKGRKMWCDVVERWSKSDLIVDEELVCSLGRLLLLGASSRDQDDILSLVEQTMGIRRLIPPLGDAKRRDFLTAIGNYDNVPLLQEPSETTTENPDPSASSSDSLVATELPISTPSPSNPSVFRPDEFTSDFAPILSKNKLRIFARPGRNTLSLLMDACIRLRAPQIANKYRILLTDPSGPYKVVPDTENLHTYLRLLRQSRSSNAAASLVEDMIKNPPPGGGVSAKTFRIAMSACVRNVNNNNVGIHAEKILRLMSQRLEEPDIKTCEMFLTLSNRQVNDWRERTRGLETLDLIIRNWRSLLTYGRVGSDIASQSARDVRETSAQEGAENDYGEDESLPRMDGTQNSRPKRIRDRLPAFRETLQTSTGRLNQRGWADVRSLIVQVISLCDKAMEQARQEMGETQMGALKRRRWELITWVGKHDRTREEGYTQRVKKGEIAGMGSRARERRSRADEGIEDADPESWDHDGVGVVKRKGEHLSLLLGPDQSHWRIIKNQLTTRCLTGRKSRLREN